MPKSKSKKAKAKKPAKSKKASIPPGFRTVTPYLAINGAAAAIDWYKKAFGAKELARQAVPDGKLMHARIRIGDSIVMLSDTFPGGAQSPDALGNSPVTLHIYINNVDKIWNQAVDAGAKITMPLDNTFWGERSHGNVRSGRASQSDRRAANRTKLVTVVNLDERSQSFAQTPFFYRDIRTR